MPEQWWWKNAARYFICCLAEKRQLGKEHCGITSVVTFVAKMLVYERNT